MNAVGLHIGLCNSDILQSQQYMLIDGYVGTIKINYCKLTQAINYFVK